MLLRYTCTVVPRHHLSVQPAPLSLLSVCVCACKCVCVCDRKRGREESPAAVFTPV